MASGKAIVSTSIGAEGLPVQHEKNILLAETPHDFARQCVRLLRDPDLRRSLGGAARRLVEEKYSWRGWWMISKESCEAWPHGAARRTQRLHARP
jgi:glycosyltransferase involved in cell wall biosynthesis